MTEEELQMWAPAPCVLCDDKGAQFSPGAESIAMECPNCGHYLVTGQAMRLLRVQSDDMRPVKASLRGASLQQQEAGKRLTIDEPMVAQAIAEWIGPRRAR